MEMPNLADTEPIRMKLKGLHISLNAGEQLGERDIDEMWALRTQYVKPKDELGPRADRDRFGGWIRSPGSTVAVARDRGGAIQVFIDMNALPFEHRGRKYLVCYGHYLYAAREYRNHPAYTFGNFGNLLAQLRRHRTWPSRHVLWIGPSLPTSFIVGVRTLPEFWAAGEAGIPDDVGEVIDHVAPLVYGDEWRAEDRLINCPIAWAPYVARSPEASAILTRYESRNPRWREGYAAMFVAPLTPRNVLGPLRLGLGRLVASPGTSSPG